ncbi:hypothetical protein HPB50_007093 [Hyalomma asiaticum]|uniref:Uncharacterized protein n=1 Tax=Hyalomma asiaticum TaxID=266040 RepID=A0ACB7SM17_HYAAI|nr:hypothetical protein HPB50_007093 [Hyalomma asiaticum]
MAGPEKGYVVLRDGEKIPIVNTMSTCMPTAYKIGTLPTAKGFFEGKSVTVLRDTGCNTVVVRETLVPKVNFTGTIRPVLLLDQAVHYLPEAIVFIDTPFFAGVVRAKCMRDPLYDVVLGNIEVALTADQGISRKPQQHEAGHADKGMKGADGTPPASGRTAVEDGQRSLENGATNVQAPKDPSLPRSLTEDR